MGKRRCGMEQQPEVENCIWTGCFRQRMTGLQFRSMVARICLTVAAQSETGFGSRRRQVRNFGFRLQQLLRETAIQIQLMAAPETPQPTTTRHAFGSVLFLFILFLVGILTFSIRLFSVIKYESVIHEFDPYFNYRVTQYLTKKGVYDFWNWFDDRTWYPLGRVIGGTVYPGLTLTVGTLWRIFNFFHIPLSVETVCVFTAPIFSAFASWSIYLLTKVPSYTDLIALS